MNIRESSFDATTAHDAIFASDFSPQRVSSGPQHAPTPIAGAGF
jgi:hypothetical protein